MKVISINETFKDSVIGGIKRIVVKKISLNNGNLVEIKDIFEPSISKGVAVRESTLFNQNREVILSNFKVRVIDKLLKCVKR